MLLVHPQLWETLIPRPPWAGALPFVGRREQAWGRGVGWVLWGRWSPSVLPRLQEARLLCLVRQSPAQSQGCFVQIPLGFCFLWMYIKVFVWPPPAALDWVSHCHQAAQWRESVPGSAPLPALGTGARGDRLLVPCLAQKHLLGHPRARNTHPLLSLAPGT